MRVRVPRTPHDRPSSVREAHLPRRIGTLPGPLGDLASLQRRLNPSRATHIRKRTGGNAAFSIAHARALSGPRCRNRGSPSYCSQSCFAARRPSNGRGGVAGIDGGAKSPGSGGQNYRTEKTEEGRGGKKGRI